MVLLIGATGFTSSRIREILNPKELVILSRKSQADAGRYVEWCVGGLEKLPQLLRQYPIHKMIYTPSPYLGKIPYLICLLSGHHFKGKLVFFTTAAITTDIPEEKRQLVHEAEHAATIAPFQTAILRPTMIYGGAGDRNMEKLLRFLKWVPFVPIPGDGENMIQPVHRDDLAKVAVQALHESDFTGSHFVGGPSPLAFNELIRNSLVFIGRPRVPVVKVPISILNIICKIIPSISSDKMKRFQQSRAVDSARVQNLLRGHFISLKAGLKREASDLGLCPTK